MLDRSWESYFPLGEENDLAFDIGFLLYELDEFEHALVYFHASEKIYGRGSELLYNIAACYQQLEQYQQARALLEEVLQDTPENEDARTLLEYCEPVEGALASV